MNFALPAITIFALLLPGIILRYTYARGAWGWSSPTSMRGVTDELAYSFIFAVGLHFLWVWLASFCHNNVDFAVLLSLLSGNFGPNNHFFSLAAARIEESAFLIALYFTTLYATATIAGYSAHVAVRMLRLDKRTKFFRFSNEWYYLLSGEMLSFNDNELENRNVDGVYLSVVIDQGKDSYLYWGIVEDFLFDKTGSLDTIVLTFAHRRLLIHDKADDGSTQAKVSSPFPDERYYEIRGDLFIIRYSQVKTLNLQYVSLPETP